jgi:hypothetical protein
VNPEQNEQIEALKVAEREAQTKLEVEQQQQRDELASAFSERWDDLWTSLGMRRDRTDFKKGRVQK